jgi:hypothetical protein
LLGLVLALALNFPLNALSKQEDDNLHVIDSFCNEVLLPRLTDPEPVASEATAGQPEALLRAFAASQERFLAELGTLTRQMGDYAARLDQRLNALGEQFSARTEALHQEQRKVVTETMTEVGQTVAALEKGVAGVAKTLAALDGKQVVVKSVKRGWFW